MLEIPTDEISYEGPLIPGFISAIAFLPFCFSNSPAPLSATLLAFLKADVVISVCPIRLLEYRSFFVFMRSFVVAYTMI